MSTRRFGPLILVLVLVAGLVAGAGATVLLFRRPATPPAMLRRAGLGREGRGMQFKKLFQVLVLGGAMVGAVAATACSQANAQDKAKKPPADAGTTNSAGSGVKGW